METLAAAANLLRPGGLLLLGTPARDAFYHRFGAWTYRWSRGRFPTLLNGLYSSHLFGHKQIFSTQEMRSIFERVGLEMVHLETLDELNFPYIHYLRMRLGSDLLARLALPFAQALFAVIRIRNKMIVVGQKPA